MIGGLIVAQWKRIWLVSRRMVVQSLASLSGLGIWHYHELWCSSQTWFRSRVAVAVAAIWSIACELPYAMGVALKRKKILNININIYIYTHLTYNVPISSVQQNDSVIHIYDIYIYYILLFILFSIMVHPRRLDISSCAI